MRNFCLIVSILVALAIPASVITATPGFAVLPDEKLSDPNLENRAREISKDIRCLVCQNQSIDDSNADLARDLRIIVRERLTAGDSNQQVKDYLVARYGDYVLLTPPLNLETVFLWAGPFLLVAIGMVIIFLWYRNRTPETDATPITNTTGLSPAERQRLAELMAEESPQERSTEKSGKM
ncbi:MAG TPA: cytochrome C biogenesis protein CcmH [Rhodospirillaceae bacterium]|nr:cytochrome C biogenesis protein CcmH [Rhodospirillaceae bacterium]MAX63779.1 cytochrome C biogenesis protein CcmH [Rhodospirillaceae bacterium]MBB56521.1 cytochrome C biogenesis protein CcmH [Rhodospirillaceae bacterium]HAE01779.1 cytochrome C biogenesis protein CcmH [Rhodospirillaceae bacterium]HAJ22372.1 cytochrome C biogenesis protein CcmH [Rhodospirillaceae bacterium]|tara:strand:+ start:184 stop:723 length:540 start_codon:yes stop_codon:yes gene_type:complete